MPSPPADLNAVVVDPIILLFGMHAVVGLFLMAAARNRRQDWYSRGLEWLFVALVCLGSISLGFLTWSTLADKQPLTMGRTLAGLVGASMGVAGVLTYILVGIETRLDRYFPRWPKVMEFAVLLFAAAGIGYVAVEVYGNVSPNLRALGVLVAALGLGVQLSKTVIEVFYRND